MRQKKNIALCVVVALFSIAGSWLGCNRDDSITPPETGEAESVIREGFMIGPVEGWTLGWHRAPETIAVPVGTSVTFGCFGESSGAIRWSGVDAVVDESNGSTASCIFDDVGTYVVELTYTQFGANHRRQCEIDVLAVSADELRIGEIALSVDEPEFGGRGREEPRLHETSSSLNEATMRWYFSDESVGRLTEVAPSHYRTSVHKTVHLSLTSDLGPFAALLEWRVNGKPRHLGGTSSVAFSKPGNNTVSCGPPGVAKPVRLTTYAVSITSHVSNHDRVLENTRVAFRATTDPPGFEEDIQWLSSTKFGTAEPVMGRGPTFVVTYENTWGESSGDAPLSFQWLGVKADHTVFNQDQKCIQGAPGPDVFVEAPIERIDHFVGLKGVLPDVGAMPFEISRLEVAARDGFAVVSLASGVSVNGDRFEFERRGSDVRLETVRDLVGHTVLFTCSQESRHLLVHDIEMGRTNDGRVIVTKLLGEVPDGSWVGFEVNPNQALALCTVSGFSMNCSDIGDACANSALGCALDLSQLPNVSCDCTGGLDTCILLLGLNCTDNGCEAFGLNCIGVVTPGDGQEIPDPLPEAGCNCCQ